MQTGQVAASLNIHLKNRSLGFVCIRRKSLAPLQIMCCNLFQRKFTIIRQAASRNIFNGLEKLIVPPLEESSYRLWSQQGQCTPSVALQAPQLCARAQATAVLSFTSNQGGVTSSVLLFLLAHFSACNHLDQTYYLDSKVNNSNLTYNWLTSTEIACYL